MKIQDVEHKYPPFDQPSGLAASLIAAGTHEQYQPPKATQPENKTVWRAMHGAGAPGPQYPPKVHVRCGNCGFSTIYEGRPEYVKAQVFRHCPAQFHIAETIPAEVLDAYKKLRNAYFKPEQRLPESGFIKKLSEVF